VRRAAAGDAAALQAALSAALRSQKPTLIACLGRPPAPDEAAEPPLPGALGGRGAGARRAWLRRLARHSAREEFDRTLSARLPPGWHKFFSEPGPLLAPGQTSASPVSASKHAFAKLAALLPELVCLPAEGAGALWQTHVQAMACAAGGMTRHGGIIPVAHTTLCNVENLTPALRTAALSGLRVIHIVSESADPCPTAGHRAGLRAMRNVFVFRPADASETLECAELALRRTHGPSVLFLSDIACVPLTDRPTRTRCVHGGFLVAEPAGRRDATLIASGADLPVALSAHAHLRKAGVATAVVSLPCWELFANQEPAWRDQILGTAPRIGVEAGSGFGWERWLGPTGVFVGSDAGPITCDKIAAAVLSAVGWTKSTLQPFHRRTS
jgi:transketolase